MKEEINLTKKELVELIAQERRLNCMEEYHIVRKELLYKVERILDLRDVFKAAKSNNRKTKKIINKYAKNYKKEKDIRKIIENVENQEIAVSDSYISAVFDLMKCIFKIIFNEIFRNDLLLIENWYDFDMEDMVLVNGLIKELKYFNSSNITVEDIFAALNLSIFKYTKCLKDNIKYIDTFEKSFPYVEVKKKQNGEENE